jgi:hypothetical protein
MELIERHDHIETILDQYSESLGNHWATYRNHVYRIFNLIELLTPRNLSELEIEKFAIASAFHDIGIWTEKTFDYLQPSMKLGSQYLASIHRETWIVEVETTIEWHHKLTAYHGPYEESVNLFRKADWIDVSRGIRNFGVPRIEILNLYSTFPELGFHLFLLKQGLAHAVRNPLRPLPMFRR